VLFLSGDGTVLAIGAYGNDGTTTNGGHGHVRVFNYTNTQWVKMGADVDGNPAFNVNFGGGVKLSNDGQTLVVSDLSTQYGTGSIKLYGWNLVNQQWEEQELLKSFTGTGANNSHKFKYGSDVDLSDDGSIMVVGGDGYGSYDSNEHSFDGMVALYHLNLVLTVENFEVFNGIEEGDTLSAENRRENTSYKIPYQINQRQVSVGEGVNFSVVNLFGQKVKNENLKGMYILKLEEKKKSETVKVFIK